MSKGYIEPTTNTSYGTNTNEGVPIQVNKNADLKGTASPSAGIVKHSIIRATATAAEEGMVSLRGGGKTSLAAAKAAGLVEGRDYQQSQSVVTVEGEDIHNGHPQSEMAEPGVSAELASAANQQLDAIAGQLTAEQLSGLTYAAAHDLDERAFAALGGQDTPLVQSYIERGLALMESVGITGEDVLSDYLSFEDQAQARLAVVRGDTQKFLAYCSQAIRNVQALTTDPVFIESIREDGFSLQNGTLYHHGQAVGDFVNLVLTGEITFDWDE